MEKRYYDVRMRGIEHGDERDDVRSPTVESAAAMKADMSCWGRLGHTSISSVRTMLSVGWITTHHHQTRQETQGIQINTFGSETQTGKEYRNDTKITVKAPKVEVPDPIQNFDGRERNVAKRIC